MFLKRHKAKERLYYYLFVYDKTEIYEEKRIYSLGNGEKALKKIADWQLQQSVPIELIHLGLQIHHLEKWRKKIEDDNFEQGLQCCSYKSYNKNRKRPQRQLESFSH